MSACDLEEKSAPSRPAPSPLTHTQNTSNSNQTTHQTYKNAQTKNSTLARQQGWKRLSTSLSDGEVYEALTPTTAAEVTDADDRSWDALFSRLEDFVEGKQDDSPDSASLQSAINQFKSQNGVAGRAAAGLDLKVDSEWVQEYAASPDKLSLNWFDNDKPLSGGDSVLKNGFRQVVDHLQSQFVAAGGKVALNATVTLVETASSPAQRVKVTAADGRSWAAPFAVVTLPVGVLQSGDVTFSPQLPADLRGAIGRLGMGTLNKVVMAFPDSAEWSDVNWIERLPLAADGGRWREFFSLRKATGKPVVVAFNAGDAALYPSSTTDQALVGQAVAALRAMFPDGGIPSAPSAYWVTRWHDDPFSYGSYSVVPPGANGRERAALAKPVGKLLYFAGEAAHKDYPSTVQGAWLSGLDAANKAASDNKSRASG